jgi:type II secretory pathway component GspD/PulD (secretin)/RNA polymerase-interacting CarD/CdnL/TRCF family regulator
MTGWHLFRKESYQSRSIVLLTVLALCGGRLSAGEASTASGTAGHEVISLTNISAERGREFLGRLTTATASKLPGSNALLITAEPSELQKAAAILNLVDSRTEFDVKELGPASAGQMPSNLQIANAVRGISIGTFAHPPQDKSKMQAIVDVHNGTLVVIAPVFQVQDIQLAVQALRQGKEDSQSESLRLEAKTPGQPGNTAPTGKVISAAAMLDSSHKTSSLKPRAASDIQLLQPAPSFEPLMSDLSQTGDSQPKDLSAGTGTPQRQPEEQKQPQQPQESTPVAEPPVSPAPLSSPGLVAEPTAPASQPATSSKPAEGESKPPTAAPSEPAQPTEPAAASTSLPPGQVAPSAATPVTPAPAQPQPPTTPSAAASATPQARIAAASPFRPAETPEGERVLDLTLQEKMPVIQLLDLVGKYLGLSYVYNPDEVKGEVSLKLNGDLHGQVKVKDLYTLLESSLRQSGLVTTRRKGNIVTIMPISRAVEGDPVLLDRSDSQVQNGDTAVTCKFELKHIDTAAAKNLLDSMKVGIDVTAIPEKHMLIVTTYAYRMERIERLLQMIDQPGEPKKFRFRQLRYTMAKTLADKVKAMAEQMLESVSVTVAESESAPSLARTPGESDATYRARVMALRAQQTQQQAALRAQQAVLRAQTGGAETKPSVYLDADERTNRVLMIGAAKQLEVVETLVDALDVEQQDLRALQLYRMKHVDADDVARKLQELGVISRLPDNGTSSRYPSTASRITPQLPGQPRLPNTPMPEPQMASTTEVTEKGLVEEPQVVVVEATNSLLVNATAEQHAKIAHIIEYVDSETLSNEIPYKIYPLENSSPKHLSEVLQNLIQETVEQQKEGGKIEKVVVNKDEKIKIVPDPNTYSLIVYANKKNQEWISTLITQLDKRRPQVLIDVTLVEITKDDNFDYDLNLVRSSPDLASTSGATGVSSSATTLGKAIGTSSTGGMTAFYGDKQVQALLNTVQEKTYGRVLAKPKLLVNDNEQGKIETKDTTYVEVTSSLPVSSGVTGTTSGLVQTATNFNSYDAGITLDITPHISEGDLLRLDINLVRSDFGTILATRPPDKKSSEVKTAVTLPNGSTVILGGMLRMSQSKGGTKVPILGDIPLLGGLFRSVHNSEKGTKLYMFVKAEIIRPDETSTHGMKGLEALSERNRAAFEKHELEFQQYESWPGIKSKRSDPSKVLDAQ